METHKLTTELRESLVWGWWAGICKGNGRNKAGSVHLWLNSAQILNTLNFHLNKSIWQKNVIPLRREVRIFEFLLSTLPDKSILFKHKYGTCFQHSKMLIAVSEGIPQCLYPLLLQWLLSTTGFRMPFNVLVLFLFFILCNSMTMLPPWTGVYHSGLSRETEPTEGWGERERLCVWRWWGLTYCKELAHIVVGAGKSEICRAGQRARNSGRISLLQFKGRIPSTEWVRPTRIIEGNLLYLKSADNQIPSQQRLD